MKKLILPLLMASVVISAVSCQKEAALEPENTEKTPSGFVRWSFTADMPETKTTLDLDAGSVTWEAGDVITLYYLDGDNAPKSVEATTETGGANATFTADIPEGDAPDHFWAAYPASSGALTYDGGEKFTITCGRVDGTFKSANIMAAYSTAAAKSFAFKHAVGIIALALPSGGIISHNETDYPITTIRVKGKETSIHSMGTVEVTSDGTSVTSFADAGGTSSAAVDINDAVRASGTAYLPSFPGTLTNGLAIRYYSNAGNIPAILTKNAAITVSRGHILPISDLTSHIVWDYYVSASGSGDGLTPATAMSVNDFLSFLEEGKNGGSNVIMCYANRINGVTFHFTAGSHSISSPITLPAQTIYSEATYYTIDGDNAASLDGGGSSRIFEFTNAGDRITIKNLTFTNGSKETGGIALIQNAAPHFENCTFTNTTSNEAGGAVRVDTASKGAGTFNGCTFSNCTGINGGAIVITNANTSLTLTDCVFSNNKAVLDAASKNGNGGALYSTNGITTIHNCRFTENTAVSMGGFAYITGGNITFSSCLIAHNHSTNVGGAIDVISATGSLYIYSCDFISNKTTGNYNGGAIYASNALNIPVYISHCKFIGNSGYQYGSAIHFANKADNTKLVFAMDNTLVYGNITRNSANAATSLTTGGAQISLGVANLVLMNNTIIANNGGRQALRCGANSGNDNALLLNNIISSETTGGYSINAATNAYAIRSAGYNQYSPTANVGDCIWSSTDNLILTSLPTFTYTAPNADNEYAWSWINTTSSGMASSEILEGLINGDASMGTEGSNVASDFLSWLKSLEYENGNAWEVDLYGNKRSGNYWPGCYQN